MLLADALLLLRESMVVAVVVFLCCDVIEDLLLLLLVMLKDFGFIDSKQHFFINFVSPTIFFLVIRFSCYQYTKSFQKVTSFKSVVSCVSVSF